MAGKDIAQLIVQSSRIKSTLVLVFLLGVLNVGTDLSVGLVPGFGDIANSFLDTIILILQLGLIAYLKSSGIEYIPHE